MPGTQRTPAASCQARGVYGAELRGTVVDSEHQRAAECRDEVTEMPAAELALAMLTEAEDAPVLNQNTGLKHVPHHRNAVIFGHFRCKRDRAKHRGPGAERRLAAVPAP